MTRLGPLSSPDVAGRNHVLLVPLGSTEQHGPHLPLDTDTRIAEAIADAAADAARARSTAAGTAATVLVAPGLPWGASGEHQGFAGTLSIGTPALTTVLVELTRSLSAEAAAVIFVNGHGGNHPAVSAAVSQLAHEGHRVSTWAPHILGGDAHAGRTETSLLLAICPALVQLDRAAAGRAEPIAELISELRSSGVRAVSPNGVLGDPAGASAAEGQSVLAGLVDQLRLHIERVAAELGVQG